MRRENLRHEQSELFQPCSRQTRHRVRKHRNGPGEPVFEPSLASADFFGLIRRTSDARCGCVTECAPTSNRSDAASWQASFTVIGKYERRGPGSPGGDRAQLIDNALPLRHTQRLAAPPQGRDTTHVADSVVQIPDGRQSLRARGPGDHSGPASPSTHSTKEPSIPTRTRAGSRVALQDQALEFVPPELLTAKIRSRQKKRSWNPIGFELRNRILQSIGISIVECHRHLRTIWQSARAGPS